MNEKKLVQAALRKNLSSPPVWFMRQAGRYHSHYQAIRKKVSFMELCKTPEIASEAALGPVEDFGFDAAILFSDLLFPLEAIGMGLDYPVSAPVLSWLLKEKEDLKRFSKVSMLEGKSFFDFQGEAIRLTREKLDQKLGLLGFVGAPLSLYCYAVEGTHKGSLISSKQGLRDGRFLGFSEILQESLLESMIVQAKNGADVMAVMDTCAGEFDPYLYSTTLPALQSVLEKFKSKCPDVPILYYSKGTSDDHWKHLASLPIEALGVDWRSDLPRVLTQWGGRFGIQGNVDPSWLFLESGELQHCLEEFFQRMKKVPEKDRMSWICGLGHGVLPKTPEDNVRLFLKQLRQSFPS